MLLYDLKGTISGKVDPSLGHMYHTEVGHTEQSHKIPVYKYHHYYNLNIHKQKIGNRFCSQTVYILHSFLKSTIPAAQALITSSTPSLYTQHTHQPTPYCATRLVPSTGPGKPSSSPGSRYPPLGFAFRVRSLITFDWSIASLSSRARNHDIH